MNIFIINLKASTERRAFMQKQFAHLSKDIADRYNIIFFDAINAAEGEHLAFKQYSKFKSLLVRGKEMSAGERACFASHYCLWQKCIESNAPIVVLEDDVELGKHFWEGLKRVEESPYAYVRLTFLADEIKTMRLSNDFYISFDGVIGTQGYYLTPVAARAFIEHAKSWYRPVDDYMDMFYIHHVPAVCIEPVLHPREIASTIEGRWSKPPIPLKIIRECSRLYFNIRGFLYLVFRKKSLLLPKEALKTLLAGGGAIHYAKK